MWARRGEGGYGLRAAPERPDISDRNLAAALSTDYCQTEAGTQTLTVVGGDGEAGDEA